ncbi:MAG: guanylate kinase [Candidatus Omnitrophica bacterium]|nr:guanylate kinase [Candidatus Omnitrophota bacterium]
MRGKGFIFVISGPSGSGKTTLLARLLKDKKLKDKLAKSVSLTTRPKRSKEAQGRDYFFLTPRRFQQLQKAKKILEWTRYLGYDYATPKSFAQKQLRAGKNLVLSLDFRGALRVKRLYPRNTVTIFILPPSLGELRQRIEKRCAKTKKEEIQKRLKLAEKEVKFSPKYDYCLTNKDLNHTVAKLRGIILNNIKPK